MSDIINPNKNISFTISDDKDREHIYTLARALASRERLKILHLLSNKPMNISAIAKELNLPHSSVSDHIAILEEAQILFVSTEQGIKRHIKMCSKQLNELTFLFSGSSKDNPEVGSKASFFMLILGVDIEFCFLVYFFVEFLFVRLFYLLSNCL